MIDCLVLSSIDTKRKRLGKAPRRLSSVGRPSHAKRTGVEGAVVDDVGVDEGQGEVGDAAEARVGEDEARDLGGDDLLLWIDRSEGWGGVVRKNGWNGVAHA